MQFPGIKWVVIFIRRWSHGRGARCNELLDGGHGPKLLVFSGDDDSNCPTTAGPFPLSPTHTLAL